MGRLYERLDDSLQAWIRKQPLFFVATAPDDRDGHLNLSPKGGKGTFRVLEPNRVAYLDMMGSGIETVAHLRENGRIVIMFCAFEGPPKIVRLYGRGRVVTADDPGFATMLEGFTPSDDVRAVARSIIVVDVTRIADSCGFVVPRMEYVGDRDQLFRWAETKQEKGGETWKEQYLAANNLVSIDGMPGLDGFTTLGDEAARELSSAGKAL